MALVLIFGSFAVRTPRAGAAAERSIDTPIVLVHGLQIGSCPGTDLARIWGATYLMLLNAGWTGPLLPVSYYQCDSNGVDITSYGPDSRSDGGDPQLTKSVPVAGYTMDTSIDRIANDLAWFVYQEYSRLGQSVDFIGASMGGLIVRAAMLHVQQHDPAFPPMLLVTDAVTVATPHKGVSPSATNSFCGAALSCQQMISGSAFLTSLGTNAPQGQGGTDWTLIGSGNCDVVPATSAVGLAPAHQIAYTRPCYSHTGYLWDLSTAMDASAYYANPGGSVTYRTTSSHALAAVVTALKSGTS